MIGSIISLIILMVLACVAIVWMATGKLPNNYNMFKSIKLVELVSGEYEVHVYHGPFRKTASNLEPNLKWFKWYKITSKFTVHRLGSLLATFDNRAAALRVIQKIKATKAEYF